MEIPRYSHRKNNNKYQLTTTLRHSHWDRILLPQPSRRTFLDPAPRKLISRVPPINFTGLVHSLQQVSRRTFLPPAPRKLISRVLPVTFTSIVHSLQQLSQGAFLQPRESSSHGRHSCKPG
ncbi:hypothetical protein E2C01_067386 [Portunus trituberculatus]|uniref:Uncharacterized protein n=1 Tax=Portunus trituberculatus TaxID=210409 RepID=A0A5B7HWK0_PORTR|nr:hypothetical protein [Portunus trituberculatus]